MAANSNFDRALQRTKKAASKAFDLSVKRMGINQDQDLRLYSMLASDDFDQLAQDFGETDVLQYIREMEKRKILEG